MLLSWKLVAVQFVVIMCMTGVGYFYFNHTQARLEQMAKDNQQLEIAVRTQTDAIKAQQEAAQRQNTQITALQTNMARAEMDRRDLEARLRRMDLQSRARTDSAGVEALINRATVQVFRDIEILTAPRDQPVNIQSAAPVLTTPTAPPAANSNVQPPPRPPATTRGTP